MLGFPGDGNSQGVGFGPAPFLKDRFVGREGSEHSLRGESVSLQRAPCGAAAGEAQPFEIVAKDNGKILSGVGMDLGSAPFRLGCATLPLGVSPRRATIAFVSRP